MDHQMLREGLHGVFGTFEAFCETLSNTTAQAISRHGVVQTPTPSLARMAHPFAQAGSSPASVQQQSARECLQKMQDLVTSPPLQPIQAPSSFNKDFLLNAEPSSSVRSTPDSREFSKKKRTKRATDSDSEAERDREKRKRIRAEKDEQSASTSGHVSAPRRKDDDQMRELFGDDADKVDVEEKVSAVSPDSGVHSTENDPGDENDPQPHSAHSILSMMVHENRLSPPLSPIKQRPIEKKNERDRLEKEQRERELKDKERREKEAKDQRKKEKERELEKERERERREKAKKEAAEKDRKEKDEKELQRRERELQGKKEQERKEKERLDFEASERELQEEERERSRRIEEEREKARRLEEERERERAKRLDEEEQRKRAGEAEKAAKREQSRALFTDSLNHIKGDLALRSLSPSKFSKLLDMGQKNGSMKVKKDVKREDSPSVDVSILKVDKKKSEKKEKERLEKREKEKDVKKEKPVKVEAESAVPSPRPGSSQSSSSGKEFRCACNECIPSKPVRPDKPRDAPDASDFYQGLAKARKRKADAETDPLLRILLYLESVVYFSLSAKTLTSTDKVGQRQVSVVRDTCEMLKMVTARFITKDQLSPLVQHFVSRVRMLSQRTQAVLAFNLYSFRAQAAWKSHSVLEQMPANAVTISKPEDMAGPSGDGKTPSPGGSSVHSNSNHGTTAPTAATATMPLEMYNCQKAQLKTLHHLMFAHRLWDDSLVQASKSPLDTSFMNSLEMMCGHMCVNMALDKVSICLVTGLTWLRSEYELEKLRPAPPAPVKRSS